MKKAILLTLTSVVFLLTNLVAQFNSTDRLIVSLPFTGNANDVSGNNNNGIVHGATLTNDRFGNPNSAYDFLAGTHAYIEIPPSPSMDSVTISSGYTFSAWIKPRSWNSGATPLLAILERHNLITDGGTNFLVFPFGPYLDYTSGSFNFQLEQWYNVVVTVDPTKDSLNYYVDGNNVGSFLYAIPIDTSNHGPYSIGTSLTGIDEYADGAIDDIQIYARALSKSEIENIVLPVTLSVFTTTKQNSTTQFSWTTLSENNTAYFEIQRSLSGSEFSTIITMQAAGNSSIQKNYKATDLLPNKGKNYYRLKMVDKDGETTYSQIRLVIFDKEGLEVNAYPVPAKNLINVISNFIGDILFISITDINGKKVAQFQRANSAIFQIPINTLKAGIYILHISNSIQTVKKKIVKM
jgi:hypothetical protein